MYLHVNQLKEQITSGDKRKFYKIIAFLRLGSDINENTIK